MIPTTVVKIPTLFDFFHPASEITAVSEKRPIRKDIAPMARGRKKSSATTFFRYPPGVVIIEIWIMANTVTRKEPAARVADFKILFVNLSFWSYTSILATTVMENPLNRELIKIICLAKAFQYSRVISITCSVCALKILEWHKYGCLRQARGSLFSFFNVQTNFLL